MSKAEKKRCPWAGSDPIYIDYHDNHWGIPVHDDRLLFEMLILEGAQAGLSWITILKKRDNYKKAFHNFNVKKVSKYTQKDFDRLIVNEGIIRNKLKIKSAIQNAKAFMEIQKKFGSFDQYIWEYVNHKPIVNRIKTMKDYQAKTELSDTISKDLKKRGFNFVGSTIIYAFMQAIGMVNDHTEDCFCK